MKPSRHKLVRRLFALGVLAFVIVGALGPAILGELGSNLRRIGYAEAGNHHQISLPSPVLLFDRPLVVAERADITLVLPDGRALDDREIAAHLRSGNAELVIEDAKLVLDATGLHPARVAAIADQIAIVLEPLRNISFARVTVRDAKLMNSTTKGDTLLGRLSCEIVKSSNELRVKGTLQRNGIPLPFDVNVNAKPAIAASGRIPVAIKIASDLLTASLTGEFVRGDVFTLKATQASVATPSAKALIAWMSDSTVAGSGLEDVRVSGPLEWIGGTMTFEEAKLSLDGNEATGGLSLSVDSSRPMLDGTLAFENLELAPFVPPRSSTVAELAHSAWDWTRWLVGGPASESLIRHIDADLRLSANSVTLGGAILGGGAAIITAKDNKLLADLAEIELDEQTEGNARVSVDLSGSQAAYAVRGNLKSSNLASITRVFSDSEIVSGDGNVEIDLKSVGNTDDEIRSSLSGNVTLSMPSGGQIAVDLASLLTAAKSGGLGWDQVSSGKTALESLNATLQADNGVLTAKAVQAATPTRNVEVAGTIDLSKRMVDLSIAAAAKPGATTTSERLRIRGPLLAPIIKAEPLSKAALSLPSGQ